MTSRPSEAQHREARRLTGYEADSETRMVNVKISALQQRGPKVGLQNRWGGGFSAWSSSPCGSDARRRLSVERNAESPARSGDGVH